MRAYIYRRFGEKRNYENFGGGGCVRTPRTPPGYATDGRDIIGQTIARYLIAGYFMTASSSSVNARFDENASVQCELPGGSTSER